MNRTVTALYATQAEAERVRDALVAAHLGQKVTIRDQAVEGDGLTKAFSGHGDAKLYAEGLRRGHILLTAKVGDFEEIRAAEILDSAAPLDLAAAETSWRQDGWRPAGEAALVAEQTREAGPLGLSVRIYTLSD